MRKLAKGAAQPLLLPADYDAWLARMAQAPATRLFVAGRSREGRPIRQLTIADNPKAGAQVVLIGRQHPPETTGALAMQAFTERLLENDTLARDYRARFTTQLLPLMNPDGVVHGHWRHNMGEVDLNRDWGLFTQPETQVVGDLLAAIDAAPDQELMLFVDFHSTFYDAIYTLAENTPTRPAGFTEAWLADYAARLPGYDVRVEPGYSASSHVAKNWVYQRYGVPSATYEIGDDTDPALIRRLGRAAAEAMMSTLLRTDAPQAN